MQKFKKQSRLRILGLCTEKHEIEEATKMLEVPISITCVLDLTTNDIITQLEKLLKGWKPHFIWVTPDALKHNENVQKNAVIGIKVDENIHTIIKHSKIPYAIILPTNSLSRYAYERQGHIISYIPNRMMRPNFNHQRGWFVYANRKLNDKWNDISLKEREFPKYLPQTLITKVIKQVAHTQIKQLKHEAHTKHMAQHQFEFAECIKRNHVLEIEHQTHITKKCYTCAHTIECDEHVCT